MSGRVSFHLESKALVSNHFSQKIFERNTGDNGGPRGEKKIKSQYPSTPDEKLCSDDNKTILLLLSGLPLKMAEFKCLVAE